MRDFAAMAAVRASDLPAVSHDIWLPTHWPRKPDPEHLWSTQRFPASSASQWDGPIDQTFTYDGQGIKITLEQWTPALNRVKSRTTMQWKMGDPWWSTYEQITDIGLGPVEEVSAKLVRVGPLAPR